MTNFFLQKDLEDPSVDDEDKVKQIKLMETALTSSDLSRKMQELLGVYLLFER